jgi:hypothetical protein
MRVGVPPFHTCYPSVYLSLFQRSSRLSTEIHVQYSTACLTVWLCRICLRHNSTLSQLEQRQFDRKVRSFFRIFKFLLVKQLHQGSGVGNRINRAKGGMQQNAINIRDTNNSWDKGCLQQQAHIEI